MKVVLKLFIIHEIPLENDNFWDLLIDFDVSAQESSTDQYYCGLCEGNPLKQNYKRHYFLTKLALWESHCFEMILRWSNEEMTADKMLILDLWESGSTRAMLLDSAQWEQHQLINKKPPLK